MTDLGDSPQLSVVQRLYAGVSGGDVQAVLSVLDKNVAVFEPESLPYGGRYDGHEGFTNLLTQLDEYWQGMASDVLEYFVGLDAVVAVVRFQATARATGRKIDTRVSELWRVRDRLIVAAEVYNPDTKHVLDILGVS